MSDSDKTRDKLVSSIRKTKAGAAKRDASESSAKDEPQPAAQARESGSARSSQAQSASAQRSSSKRSQAQKSPAQARSAESERSVPFMHGTRVWPD